MSKKALVVEDDENIAELLRLYLEKDGFTVAIADNGISAISEFERFKPDLVMLDIMLPALDGWGVCREIRAISNVPIIFLTAKEETHDKVSGLEMGADDYLVKPFEVRELIARIHAVLRRFDSPNVLSDRQLSFDNLVIDMNTFELTVRGKRVNAPPKEMELLYRLASKPNRVFTRNQLLDEIWSFDYFGDSRTVDVHVKRLREKLENASDKWTLKTIWGVGYKFEVNEDEDFEE
jgi:DNA-binding response OmpR family regulator